MKLPDGHEWSFWAANDVERAAWLSDLSTTKDMLELNLLTDANLQAAAGTLNRIDRMLWLVIGNYLGQGFQVLHATYGKINSSKETMDVTAKLRDISAAQGGRGLMLRATSREKVRGANSS